MVAATDVDGIRWHSALANKTQEKGEAWPACFALIREQAPKICLANRQTPSERQLHRGITNLIGRYVGKTRQDQVENRKANID